MLMILVLTIILKVFIKGIQVIIAVIVIFYYTSKINRYMSVNNYTIFCSGWICTFVTSRMLLKGIRNKRQSIPKGKILCFVPNGFYLNPPEETFFCVNNIILPIFLCVCLLHDGHIWSVEIGRSSWWLNIIIDAWMEWKHIKEVSA